MSLQQTHGQTLESETQSKNMAEVLSKEDETKFVDTTSLFRAKLRLQPEHVKYVAMFNGLCHYSVNAGALNLLHKMKCEGICQPNDFIYYTIYVIHVHTAECLDVLQK